MEFSLVTQDKLKVMLNREDLSSLGVDSSNLNYSDDNTRQVLFRLLEQGRAEAGFHPKRAKLYIEVYPGGEGGCVIYYTRLTGGELSKGKYLPGPVPVVFAFQKGKTLLQCCQKIFPLCGHRIYKSSLFKLGGEYRLVVWPLDFSDNLSVTFLSEYGKRVGEGNLLITYIEEHGTLLWADTAMDTLAK